MEDSSSSSDEEANERLRSAVWDFKQPQMSLTVGGTTETTNGNQSSRTSDALPSLRISKSETEFSEDVGVIKASPELKSFVAKKLTKYLDGVIKEYAPDKKKPTSSDCEDEFKLFSTSKAHDPADAAISFVNQRVKRKTCSSSSDSDSEGERLKLASVAVSLKDVIHSQSVLSAVAKVKPAELVISDQSGATKSNSNHDSSTGNNTKNTDICLQESRKKRKKKKKTREKLEIPNSTNKSSLINEKSSKFKTQETRASDGCEDEIDNVRYQSSNKHRAKHSDGHGSIDENSKESARTLTKQSDENGMDSKINEDVSRLGVKKHRKSKKKRKLKEDINV